jgi:hypothetical protein
MSEKKISIIGKTNKYQIRKLTEERTIEKKKNITNIDTFYYKVEEQYNILNSCYIDIIPIMQKEIKKKMSSYKQQDKLKDKLDVDKFITYENIIDILKSTICKCFYCKDDMLLFYENKNDKKQWTLDRINNDIGHNKDNVVPTCLQCNIQKRRRDHDKFIFTKNLIIDKV